FWAALSVALAGERVLEQGWAVDGVPPEPAPLDRDAFRQQGAALAELLGEIASPESQQRMAADLLDRPEPLLPLDDPAPAGWAALVAAVFVASHADTVALPFTRPTG